jgi:hypothetical protein
MSGERQASISVLVGLEVLLHLRLIKFALLVSFLAFTPGGWWSCDVD